MSVDTRRYPEGREPPPGSHGSPIFRDRAGGLRRVVPCAYCEGCGWERDPEDGRRSLGRCEECAGTGNEALTLEEPAGG